jgi:hypothetical protein
MKVTDVFFITREDGTEYIKTIFDTAHYAVLEQSETKFKVLTPRGRKASQAVHDCAVKAINVYYDNLDGGL